jgi:hypothetical protein
MCHASVIPVTTHQLLAVTFTSQLAARMYCSLPVDCAVNTADAPQWQTVARQFQILVCHSLDLVTPIAGSFGAWAEATKSLPFPMRDMIAQLGQLSLTDATSLAHTLIVALIYTTVTLTSDWSAALIDASELLERLERMISRNDTFALPALATNQVVLLLFVCQRNTDNPTPLMHAH